MALIEQGILGAFRGHCGPVIGYIRNGVPCIRTMPSHYHDRRSKRQLENRSRFSMVMKVMSVVRPVISLGFKRFASDMTEMNVATRANYHTLVKTHSGRQVYDFSQLLLSKGPVEKLSDLITTTHGTSISFIWNPQGVIGGQYDQLSVVFFNADRLQMSFHQSVATRQDGQLTLSLPSQWSHDQVYCYTLLQRNNDWSNSTLACSLPISSRNPQPLSNSEPHDLQSFTTASIPDFTLHQTPIKVLSPSPLIGDKSAPQNHTSPPETTPT